MNRTPVTVLSTDQFAEFANPNEFPQWYTPENDEDGRWLIDEAAGKFVLLMWPEGNRTRQFLSDATVHGLFDSREEALAYRENCVEVACVLKG